jgi:RNA polymerase sigma-70 factor (sigma-E family)
MPNDSNGEFVEYVSARLARLHRAAYLMCGDPHRADDLVQASLISLYMRWKQARDAENLDGYMHRIMVRRFIDERRSRWARVLLRDQLPDIPSAPDASVEDHDSIVAALRRLPKGQRAVIVLRYFSDMSVEATAAALGCSVGNVKSQCARGLANLRDALSAHDFVIARDPRRS